MAVPQRTCPKCLDTRLKQLRGHQQAGGELIGLDLLRVHSGARSRIPRSYGMAVIYVNMFSWFELMPKVKMSDLVRDGKPSPVRGIAGLDGDSRCVTLADQQA